MKNFFFISYQHIFVGLWTTNTTLHILILPSMKRKLFSLFTFLILSQLLYGQCGSIYITVDKTAQCAPGIVKFVAHNVPENSNLLWNLGKGFTSNTDTVYEFFLNAAVVDVDLNITFSNSKTCSISRKAMTTIFAKPSVSYHVSRTKLCQGPDTATFINTTPNTKEISWIVDGTNYSTAGNNLVHQFKTIGSKEIAMIVTDSFGCKAIEEFKDVLVIHPKVDIGISGDDISGCITKNINYTSSINSFGENITQYDWTFPGGHITKYQGLNPPKITYKQPGNFDVGLKLLTSNGCTHEVVREAYVTLGDSTELKIDFSDTLVCFGNTVTIKTDSINNGYLNFQIEGTPLIDTLSNNKFILTYDQIGTYDVSLLYNNNGCSSYLSVPDAIRVKKVIAEFNSDDNFHCHLPHVTHLDNVSTNSDNGTLAYQWNYYDQSDTLASTSNLENDSFVSNDWGVFHVELIAKDAFGCADTMIRSNFIRVDKIRPQYRSYERIGCVDQEITLESTTPRSSYLSPDFFYWYIYDLDDSTVYNEGSGHSIKQSFSKEGFYDVRMVAYNTIGCRDTAFNKDFIEIIKPEIGFSILNKNSCGGDFITINTTTTPTHAKFTFGFDVLDSFGNVVSSLDSETARTRRFEYRIPGSHDLRYRHDLNGGCRDTSDLTDAFFVNAIQGSISLSNTNGCLPLNITTKFDTILNYHKGSPSEIINFQWSSSPATGVIFDDPNSANPAITFTEPNEYIISLRARNSRGCVTKINSEIVNAGVDAEITCLTNSICAGKNVTYLRHLNLLPNSSKWVISGDGKFNYTESGDTLFLTPLDNGKYTVNLIAEKFNTCFDTATKDIESIVVVSNFELENEDLFCAPAYAQFKANCQNADTLIWDFGDGSNFKTTDTSVANIYLNNTGKSIGHTISLIAANNFGCSDTLIKQNLVKIIGPVPRFEVNNQKGCEMLGVGFVDRSEGVYSYLMNFNDGSALDSLGIGTHYYSISNGLDSQSFIPSLMATDSLGCSAVYVSEDTILVKKSPKISINLNTDNTCVPYNIKLQANTAQGSKWSWILDGDEKGVGSNLNLDITIPGQHLLGLRVDNNLGCNLTKAFDFVTYERPSARLDFFTPPCLTDSVKFNLIETSPEKTIERVWFLNGTLITTGPSKLIQVFAAEGLKYISVEIKDTNGCKAAVIDSIQVNNPLFNYTPAIDFTSINAENDIEIYWSPTDAAGLSHMSVYHNDVDVIYNANLNSALNTVYNFPDLSQNNCFTMTHTNICGTSSDISNTHCPMVLTVQKAGLFELKIDWTAYTGWDEIDYFQLCKSDNGIDYYEIQRFPNNVLSYVDTSLCDQTYGYYVRAYYKDFASNSNMGFEAPLHKNYTLSTNVEIATVQNNNHILIRWNDVEFEKDLQYALRRYNSGNGTMDFEAITSDTSYTDLGVDVQKGNYVYTVNTIDHCLITNPNGRKGKPILLTGEYLEMKSYLTWTEYEDWYDGVKYYRIELLTESGFETIATLDGNISSFVDTEFHAELQSKYCYRIIAVSHNNLQSLSNEICIYGISNLLIPTAFSPNGDGINASFKPFMQFMNVEDLGNYETFEFKVYNRWGELLFITNNVNEGWDGTWFSKPSPIGAYMYTVRAKGLDDKLFIQKGIVNLLR
ncbi:MAG: gliding motility-associated-like protein [Bacteroidia bacterium]|jgi:gliding motility-associated-like protein